MVGKDNFMEAPLSSCVLSDDIRRAVHLSDLRPIFALFLRVTKPLQCSKEVHIKLSYVQEDS